MRRSAERSDDQPDKAQSKFEASVSYDFTDSRGRRFKGLALRTETRGEKAHPKFPTTDIKCNLANVDIIHLRHGAEVKIFWDKLIFGPKGDVLMLKQKARDSALVVSCEGQVLIARTEPLSDGRIGCSVYNAEGRVVLIGVGDLAATDDKGRLDTLVATLSLPYEGMTWSPKGCAHVRPYIKKKN